ncbi:hypothetical protein DQQ10_25750 [Pseudochryseolinea flava]|uniref:Tetratricopeptide repeat protein n=2 Tax=Pseudochryseolinea flava TaxID=2059302 RepID=A0A364XUU9_9BACT|nr:hypothetical protein DQQ10_25750 [Pseudochryseolinea flava]
MKDFRSGVLNSRVIVSVVTFVVVLTALGSCANYYQKHFDFNQEFERGDLKQALETLKKNDREENGRGRFIYYVNNGLLLSVLGQYEASNNFLEKAFLFGEDYHVNYFNEAAAYFLNPNFTVYRGEDHEHLMLLYFKAINFLKMNKPEDALIECRRLNIRLNQLGDKYKSTEKLQRDAFIHNLMGIIYQSTKDYNNAFIAYRNALDVYENEYARMFSMQVPTQLKKDILNTAVWTGFYEEFEDYKLKFNMADYMPPKPDAELIFFWHNGLGPVKEEWSVNFVIDHNSGNVVVFNNQALGFSFPYEVKEDKDRTDLRKLEVFRVAFPRYTERALYYQSAAVEVGGQSFPVEIAEDINKVAFQSLKQRMLEEFSKGLVRAALKKAAEHSMRKENEGLGAVMGLVNAMTEKADTRNWQTLPHSIHYARIPLVAGANDVTFTVADASGKVVPYKFTYQAKKDQTLFHTFSSLETSGTLYRYY